MTLLNHALRHSIRTGIGTVALFFVAGTSVGWAFGYDVLSSPLLIVATALAWYAVG